MASVDTAKDERMMMELPTKWEEAPRRFTLGGLLGKGSLSDGAPLTVSMVTVCPGRFQCRGQIQPNGPIFHCVNRIGNGLARTAGLSRDLPQSKRAVFNSVTPFVRLTSATTQ
ncbi:unnamed protein product [Merluccius merluccius]